MADWLRRADWLSLGRARAWGRVLFLACLAMTLLRWVLLPLGLLPWGDPRDVDFASFWAAGRLALEGHAAWAYDPARHGAVQEALGVAGAGYAAFFYPPVFLLACLPLGLLGFLPALFAWLALTGAAWLAVARRFLPAGAGWLGLLALPAGWNNLWHGQNGFLSTALLGAGALALDRRPFLAGMAFGCLSFKPQLALLIGPVLLAARRWRAIAGAGVAVLGLAALSWLVFGGETWAAFLANGALARRALEEELVGSAKMQSVFAATRLLGGGVGLGYAFQGIVALVAVAVAVACARRRPGGMAEGALIGAGAILVSPFVLDYDLVLLSLPLGFVICAAVAGPGFLAWEKAILAGVVALPLVGRSMAIGLGIPLAPVVCGALLWVVARRSLSLLTRPSNRYLFVCGHGMHLPWPLIVIFVSWTP